MKAVSNLRTRMRMNTDGNSNSDEPAQAQARRRARTSGSEAFAFLSPPLTDTGLQRAWAVCPRKLRGLHASPVIIYVRENPGVLTPVMDRLYGTLVSTYGVDSRDMRVTDVPTAFDVPSAVRRMGKDKQLVVVVAVLTRDKLWFDEGQIARVRDFLLTWSQQNAVPLVDGILVADSPLELQRRVCMPHWNIKASERIAGFDDVRTGGDVSPIEMPPTEMAATKTLPTETPSTSAVDTSDASAEADGYTFGHYLAHRAIEMFYFEHRGW